MLSKRDKLFEAAEQLAPVCPVCASPLRRTEQSLGCANGHIINVNRKGYVNFLSKPVEGCYDAALFDARKRVLAAGCYQPVADAIESLLPPAPQRILDAGCGEGWYLNTLLQKHPGWTGAGIDISRDAIQRAADHPCTALWCVGDLRSLPFANGAFTAVLDVLTPANYAEFGRVLAPDGLLIKVYPGSDYLQELRKARGMARYEEGQVDAYLREKSHLLDQRRVTVVKEVDASLWSDFVWMTPLNQDLSPKEKQRFAQQPESTVTIDLHIAAARLSH